MPRFDQRMTPKSTPNTQKFGAASQKDRHRTEISAFPELSTYKRVWIMVAVGGYSAKLTGITLMFTFKQTGGARIGSSNATYPFAILSCDDAALNLSCFGREYHFPRSSIRRLSRHRGLTSVGLRIEHTRESLPEFIVFWSSMPFWSSRFDILVTELEALRYNVATGRY